MRKAFTLIELLVAVAIIGILATLVTINLTSARTSSRDARRQTDVKNYTAALEKYHISNTSYFVTDTGGCGAVGSTPTAATPGCTGAEGASYGRMNFKSPDGPLIQEAEKTYAHTTIAEALLNRGLIDKIAKDPSNNKDDTTPDQSDYVLIRCEKDGSQASGRTDAGFAIWTQLEKTPSLVSAETTTTSCGGSLTNFLTESTASFGSTKLKAAVSSVSSGSDVTSSEELSKGYFAAGSGRMVAKRTSSGPVPPVGTLPTASCSDPAAVMGVVQPDPTDDVLIGGVLCNDGGTFTSKNGGVYAAQDIVNNGTLQTGVHTVKTTHLTGGSRQIDAAETHSRNSSNPAPAYRLPTFSEYTQNNGIPSIESETDVSSQAATTVDQQITAAKNRLNGYLSNSQKVTTQSRTITDKTSSGIPVTLNNAITVIPGDLSLSGYSPSRECSLTVQGILIIQGALRIVNCSLVTEGEVFVQGGLDENGFDGVDDAQSILESPALTVLTTSVTSGRIINQGTNAYGTNIIKIDGSIILEASNFGGLSQSTNGDGSNTIQATDFIFRAKNNKADNTGSARFEQSTNAKGVNSIKVANDAIITMDGFQSQALFSQSTNSTGKNTFISGGDLMLIFTNNQFNNIQQSVNANGTNILQASTVKIFVDGGYIQQSTNSTRGNSENRIEGNNSLILNTRTRDGQRLGNILQGHDGDNILKSDQTLVILGNVDSSRKATIQANKMVISGNLQVSYGATVVANSLAVDGDISLVGARIQVQDGLFTNGKLTLSSPSSSYVTALTVQTGKLIVGAAVNTRNNTTITVGH